MRASTWPTECDEEAACRPLASTVVRACGRAKPTAGQEEREGVLSRPFGSAIEQALRWSKRGHALNQ